MTRDSLFESRGWRLDWTLAQYVALVEHVSKAEPEPEEAGVQ